MITSSDLMVMLKASMNPPSKPTPGYVVGELQDPTGRRRADALYLPLGHGRRGEIHGYEFKISRTDLMTELADPMKADPWLKYCTTWNLLVSDPALVRGLEDRIPEQWGILAPPAPRRRALTVLRPAPKLTPVHNTDALTTVIARLYYGDGPADDRIGRLTAELEYSQGVNTSLRNDLNDALQQLARLDPTSRDRNRELVAMITTKLDRGWYARAETLGVDRIVDLITDVTMLDKLRDNLAEAAERDLRDLEDVHASRGRRLKQAREQLKNATTKRDR